MPAPGTADDLAPHGPVSDPAPVGSAPDARTPAPRSAPGPGCPLTRLRPAGAIAALLLALGCAGGPRPPVTVLEPDPAPDPLEEIGAFTPVSAFRPMFEVTGGRQECEKLPSQISAPGVELWALRWGRPKRREITVTLDPDRRLVVYQEIRGDLTYPFDDGRTTILLNFLEGIGYLMNTPPGEGARPEVVNVDPVEAFEDPRLGPPSEGLRAIVDRCIG